MLSKRHPFYQLIAEDTGTQIFAGLSSASDGIHASVDLQTNERRRAHRDRTVVLRYTFS